MIEEFRTIVAENPAASLGVASSSGAVGMSAILGILSSIFGFILIMLSIWLTVLSIQDIYRKRRAKLLEKQDNAR